MTQPAKNPENMSVEQGLLLYTTYNDALKSPDLPPAGKANLIRERDRLALFLDAQNVNYPKKV